MEQEINNVVEALKKGVVRLEYTKESDGSTRVAFGTLNPDIIPYNKAKVDKLVETSRDMSVAIRTGTAIGSDLEDLDNALAYFLPKDTNAKEPNPAIQVYYDLDKQSFRSFKVANFKTML